MEIRLRLDAKVDTDVIAEIKKIANGGPASKALYRIVLEWFLLRQSNLVPKVYDFAENQGRIAANQGQNENNLTDVLSGINQEW